MDFKFITDYFESLNVDVFLPLAILIFLVIVPWGPEVWQTIFTVLFGVKGIALLLFPEKFATFVVLKEADALHLQEFRCIGIILITDCLCNVLTRKSQDPTVKSMLLWSRTTFFALYMVLLIATVPKESVAKKSNINERIFSTSLPMVGLCLLGFLYYSLSTTEWGGYTEPGRTCRQFHIRADFFIFFFHGLLTFVFPKIACHFQTTLEDLDNAHGFLARTMGAGFLMMSFVALRSANFFSEEDKRNVLLSHGIANLLFLMTMVFCQLFTKVFSEWHLMYGMSFVAITAVNAFMGCDLPNMMTLAKFQLKRFLITKDE